MQSQSDLLEFVLALGAAGALARGTAGNSPINTPMMAITTKLDERKPLGVAARFVTRRGVLITGGSCDFAFLEGSTGRTSRLCRSTLPLFSLSREPIIESSCA
jgi:hypothetical protein